MRLLVLLDATPLDDAVLGAARRLSQPGDLLVLAAILPERAVRETRSSRLPGSHGGPRIGRDPIGIPTATGQFLPSERLRAEPAESRAAAASRLMLQREVYLRSTALRRLADRQTAIEVDVARVPAGRILPLARAHRVDAIVTGVEALSWRERLRHGDRARALIAAAQLPVFVIPAGAPLGDGAAEAASARRRAAVTPDLARLVEGTPAPAFALDDAFRVCAMNGAAASAFAIARDRVMGRPCWEVLRPVDQASLEACGEGCPLLTRLQAGEAVEFGAHRWRPGGDAAPFEAVSIAIPPSLREREGALALFVGGCPA